MVNKESDFLFDDVRNLFIYIYNDYEGFVFQVFRNYIIRW